MDPVENQIVVTDYKKFKDVAFKDSKLVYKGGQPPEFINCSFIDTQWVFEGDAINTLNLLRSFGSSKQGQDMVVKNFLRFNQQKGKNNKNNQNKNKNNNKNKTISD